MQVGDSEAFRLGGSAVGKPLTPRLKLHPRLVLLLLTGTWGVLTWCLDGPFVFPLDDAYITINNAQALLQGKDASYAVSPLVGATSLVHLAMVTLGLTFCSPVLGSYIVSFLGLIAYTQGVWALAEQKALEPRQAALLLLVALGGCYAAYHVLNGLETVWAMAGVTWALVLSDRPTPILAALCGFLPFVRPELAALSGLLMLRQALLRRRLPGIALDTVVFAGCAAPWLAWSYFETGALVANTVSAKAAFFGEVTRPLAWKCVVAAQGLARGLGLLLLPIATLRRSSLTAALWIFCGVVLTAFIVTLPGGLSHNYYRYQCVLLPVVLFALSDRGGTRLLPISALWSAGMLCAGLFGICHARPFVRDGLAAGSWAKANLPADTRVLVHDAGTFAFASRLPLTDIVGLKTPAAIPEHRRFTQPDGGKGRWRALDAIGRKSGARYVEVLDVPFWADLVRDYRQAGWRLDPLRARPGGYFIYHMTPST